MGGAPTSDPSLRVQSRCGTGFAISARRSRHRRSRFRRRRHRPKRRYPRSNHRYPGEAPLPGSPRRWTDRHPGRVGGVVGDGLSPSRTPSMWAGFSLRSDRSVVEDLLPFLLLTDGLQGALDFGALESLLGAGTCRLGAGEECAGGRAMKSACHRCTASEECGYRLGAVSPG